MSKTYYWQTTASMVCGRVAACSGLANATTSRQKTLGLTAPGGTLTQNIKVAGGGTVYRAIHLQPVATEPGLVNWPAGDWTVKVKTSLANANIIWDSFYICRVDAACGTYTTIASRTGINRTMHLSSHVYSRTAFGAAASSGAQDDMIYVILGFKSANASAQTLTVIMDKGEVVTPLGVPVNAQGSSAGAGSTTGRSQARRRTQGSSAGAASVTGLSRLRVRASGSAAGAASTSGQSRVTSIAIPLASPMGMATPFPGPQDALPVFFRDHALMVAPLLRDPQAAHAVTAGSQQSPSTDGSASQPSQHGVGLAPDGAGRGTPPQKGPGQTVGPESDGGGAKPAGEGLPAKTSIESRPAKS